jgi:regulator of sigma E protease
MELILGIIVGAIALTFLVAVHELGHAIVARRNGVVVEEFGIGFPPKVWAKKLKNGVLFSVNALPLGGFVKLQGEHDAARKKGDYGAATFWVKTKILLAGVLINWLTAVVLFTILALTGLPKVIPNQFSIPSDTTTFSSPVTLSAVEANTPADKAGLKKGDAIVRFAGQQVLTTDALLKATKDNKGKKVEVIYNRGGNEQRTFATLRGDNNDKKGYLGVGTAQQDSMRSTWSAPIVGVMLTGQLTGATFDGLGKLVGNLVMGLGSQLSGNEKTRQDGGKDLQTAGDSVAGPIGILGVLFPAAQQAGLSTVILVTALISLTLAVMNVLPIPALDGGRWFTMAVFRLLKKPLTKDREEKIQAAGFLTLMALVVVVTVLDVTKFFK